MKAWGLETKAARESCWNHTGWNEFHQPSIRSFTTTMILLSGHPGLCRVRERLVNRTVWRSRPWYKSGCSRCELSRVRRPGAQHPVEPYCQLASGSHLGHRVVLSVAAVQIFFAKRRVKPYGGLCRLHQQRSQESVALLAELRRDSPVSECSYGGGANILSCDPAVRRTSAP